MPCLYIGDMPPMAVWPAASYASQASLFIASVFVLFKI